MTDRLSATNISGPDRTAQFLSGVLSYRWNVAPIEKKVWQWQKHALVYWFILSSGACWAQPETLAQLTFQWSPSPTLHHKTSRPPDQSADQPADCLSSKTVKTAQHMTCHCCIIVDWIVLCSFPHVCETMQNAPHYPLAIVYVIKSLQKSTEGYSLIQIQC